MNHRHYGVAAYGDILSDAHRMSNSVVVCLPTPDSLVNTMVAIKAWGHLRNVHKKARNFLRELSSFEARSDHFPITNYFPFILTDVRGVTREVDDILFQPALTVAAFTIISQQATATNTFHHAPGTTSQSSHQLCNAYCAQWPGCLIFDGMNCGRYVSSIGKYATAG